MHMHDLVSELMRPADAGNETARIPDTAAGEQGISGVDALSSVAKVTLQAIRAEENSTVELIQVVWRLALRCGVP